MKQKWLYSTLPITLLFVIAFLGLADRDAIVAAQDEGEKIEAALQERLATQGSADFIVRFTEQADLSPAYAMDWKARGVYVYNTLSDIADYSQVNAKATLRDAGLKYQTFIAGNELYVWNGTLTDAEALAALPEVSIIRATRTYSIDPVQNDSRISNISWAGDLLANQALTTVDQPSSTIDWGITDTHANEFWASFSNQGEGIVVANIDTGVQWNHPALDQAFKCGSNPSDPSCWSDPSGICGGSMCDNNGHGTHTMGTMVGDDDPSLPYTVGMAPGAQWIACKGCETNSCSDLALNSCADWILAPDGNPANRPNIVNNSWGGGGGDTWYQAKVIAWQAAGIFPAFSAGNSTGCGSLGSPGDYQQSFGSTAHNSVRTHYYGQGPSDFGDDPYTKPNITAPGISICSSVPTNNWNCSYSGTSMASPHSAGAVALLWSCNPTLIGQINQTFELLQDNADPPDPSNPTCGVPPDNEGTYEDGYGYLNVLAAGNIACTSVETGILQGHVVDQNLNPVKGATVSAQPAEGNTVNTTTDSNGYYSMELAVGTYIATASKLNYTPQAVTGIVIADGVTTTQDFQLEHLGGTIEGHIYNQNLDPVAYVKLNATPGDFSVMSDGTGFYSFDLMPGVYDVTASKVNYTSQTAYDLVVTANQTTEHDFNLIFLGGWELGPSMCFDLTRHDAEFYPATGLIYIMGGRGGADGSATFGDIYSFNPTTGECLDTGANMRFPISNYTISLVNNGTADVLCTFGGRGSDGNPVLSIQCYNPLSNVATSVGNLPSVYSDFIPGAQVVFDNKVFVFGGFRNTLSPYQIARTYRYDPITKLFDQVGNLSLARSYIDAVVVDGKIYAFGGNTFDGTDLHAQTRTEVMADPGGVATWNNAAVAELPAATAEGRAFGFDTGGPYELAGKIVIVGGGQWPEETAEVFTYNPYTDSYDSSFQDLQNARRDHAGALIPGDPGQMWVFGGRHTVDTPPYMPAEYFNVQLAGHNVPNITVSPISLSATLLPDTTQMQHLNIGNVGDVPLTWSIVETPITNLERREPEQILIPEGGWPEAPKIDAISTGEPDQAVISEDSPLYQEPETVLYNNGPLVTHPGGGSGGADASALQSALGMEAFGFGNSFAESQRLADDFAITAAGGWQIDQITFLAFQTGSTTACTINQINYRIWDGPPNDPGSMVVFGDTTTNRLASCAFSNIYRVQDSGLSGTSRPVMAVVTNAGVNLPPGTYWIDWQTGGTLSSGPWVPPVTSLGQTTTGNGMQFAMGVWAPITDIGPQGLPFIIDGNAIDVPWLSETPTNGSVQPGQFTDVAVTFDSHGLTLGSYSASLLITSNDPDEPVVNVPIELNVINMTMEKTAPTEAISGDTIPYTIKINSEPGLVGTAVLTDTIPSGASYVTGSLVCNSGTCTFNSENKSVHWTGHDQPASVTIEFDVQVTGQVNSVVNTAGLWLDGLRASASATTKVYSPDIQVTPTSLEATLLPGDSRILPLTISNGGTSTLTWNLTDDAGWLSEVPTSGTAAIGGVSEVAVTFSTANLSPGAYNAHIFINSNDPDEPQVTVNVSLTVSGPEIVVTAPPLNKNLTIGETGTITFTIGNIGATELDWSLSEEPAVTWLGESPTSGTVLPTGVDIVTVTFDATGLDIGVYQTTIVITSNDADEGSIRMDVTLSVIELTRRYIPLIFKF